MTYKEILNRIRLVGDIIDNRVYLAIVKKDEADGIVEISEQREFSKEEIIKTIFQLSRIFLENENETSHTFHNKKQCITISVSDYNDKSKSESKLAELEGK